MIKNSLDIITNMSVPSKNNDDENLYEQVQSDPRDSGTKSYEVLTTNPVSTFLGSGATCTQGRDQMCMETSDEFATYVNVKSNGVITDGRRDSDDGREVVILSGIEETGKKVEYSDRRLKVYMRLTIAGLTLSFLAFALFGALLGLLLSRTIEVTGPMGAPGPKGDMGLQGIQGEVGLPGPKGSPGTRGATGRTGPKGDKGDLGGKGAKGTMGSTGPQGQKGSRGQKGTKGQNGSKGQKGEPGTIT